jgi:hypothetical protein
LDNALAQTATAVASLLALVLSAFNLYLQRKDRRSRLGIRVRYEYRASGAENTPAENDAASPRIYDASQERLYLLLGDFLREHNLEYPQGVPLVRFALSNEGQRPVYLNGLRFMLSVNRLRPGARLVLDPVEGRVVRIQLAGESAGVLGQQPGATSPIELLPGDGVGYKFELIRLANILKQEGYTGNVRLVLEAVDRLGNTYRRPFEVNTDLWAYPDTSARKSG